MLLTSARCSATSARLSARSWKRFAKVAFGLALLLGLGLVCGCSPKAEAPQALKFEVALDPARPAVGAAKVSVRLTDAAGAPVTSAEVRVEGNMNHAGMKPSFAELHEEEPGVYRGAIEFTMGGDWYLLITAKTPDGAIAEHKIDVAGVQTQ